MPQAQLEEADIKIAQVTKDQFEFKRDINSHASGKPISEKVIHSLEEKLRIKDSMVDKLNFKNGSLKQEISKLENQQQHKEEMGEVLHAIDFDQLKIENQQYLGKIEERNRELLQLKLTTGHIVQTLNACKKKLDKLIIESATLKKMIGEKQALSKTVHEEIETIDGEKAKAKKANASLQKQIEESGMPEVLEYVNQKATSSQLKKELANLERKVEIAAMQARRRVTQRPLSDKGWR
jgi:chromosome segregation ATPase